MSGGQDRGAQREALLRAAEAAGYNASGDLPVSVLMAEARNSCPPGGLHDKMAASLAADLAAKGAEPVSRATCAALVRAAANLRALDALGWEASDILAVLGFAAAKLEMQAAP